MFQAAITQNEQEMTALEAERKCLMELTVAKFQKEDELDDICSSDEEQSEDGDESEVKDAVPGDTENVMFAGLNTVMMELAYFGGQERDIVPRSPDLALAVLDGIFASTWNNLHWSELSEVNAVLLAEFFSHNGDAYGGYNRVQIEKLKQLPVYMNVRNVACPIHGSEDFFLIPPDLNLTDIPVPPNAQQRFLKSNPRLNTFYKDLGVKEMSDSKLLIFAIPMYKELQESQRDQILQILLRKWQSLHGNAELVTLLRTAPLFCEDEDEARSYNPAGAYCDPRNSVLATIYAGVRGQFPAKRFQTPEWLDLMCEIGLRTEVTVDIFVECAQRIDGLCSGKHSLTSQDEHLVTTLHQFFVQHFDKFDRSRSFFERVSVLAFVPAIVYEATNTVEVSDETQAGSKEQRAGQFTSRTVVRKYKDCAIPEDQALVYSTMPILANVALPPRVLWSRLGVRSPPPDNQVVVHLLSITNSDRALSSRSLDWQFFLPMVEVFQTIFKFLQENWDGLGRDKQRLLKTTTVIPVGSTLVKGSRLFFHLGDNLAPLMFEVPRAFGAYDTLFRHMGSKDAPEVRDYLRLLRDLNDECRGQPLNLNELIAATRAVELLAAALTEANHRISLQEKKSIFLPSGTAVMQSMLVMAYNDSAALCGSIDLTELHMVHPRVSTRCCQILGVPGITSVVTEELGDADSLTKLVSSHDVAHFNGVITSQPFADGLRKVITVQQQKEMSYDPFGFRPDFEDLNQRIVNLATFEVKCVAELHTRFIASLGFPSRKLDVTKTARQDSLCFLDQPKKEIYIAKRTLDARSGTAMRATQLVARCINQLLGGILQDGSVLESLLSCNESEIPEMLQLLDICEDPVLIVEKLRGQLDLPTSVVAITPETQTSEDATGSSSAMALAPVVSTVNVLSAVNDLLSRLNVSLDTSVEDLMAENLRLQRRLELAEDGRRAAAQQIDAVLREKKDIQDSLVCAVCLENKVNRVLIPCGHIYCGMCVEQLPRPSCPICRQRISSSSAFHMPS
ncbi:hypothetical protein JM16_005916 [Phytophthora kernoviae]|uniref:RING-type domain-containing protein n=1 Tax=Phytophthora kernoviae TaxID=325452 RepID=A0A8T0LV49_9STRA|nr:hypothetical protein JM16_005916 [Phytophthora kernoviae]